MRALGGAHGEVGSETPRGGAGAPPSWSADTLALLEAAVREDLGPGDLTAEIVVRADLEGRACVRAKADGIVSGLAAAEWVFRRLDPQLRIARPLREGEGFAAGDTVMELSGRVRSILTGERVALNFLQRLSGIATLTRDFVRAVAGTGAVIVDTRKTTPGWRELERAAVRAGGGANHRFGLFDAVLVKDNHVRAAGGVAAALARVHRALGGREGDAIAPSFVEVEVRGVAELEEALSAGARTILLDNFPPAELVGAVRVARERAPGLLIEASGGMTLACVREVALAGVDRISVGALTHSAPAVDLSLILEEIGLPGSGAEDPRPHLGSP